MTDALAPLPTMIKAGVDTAALRRAAEEVEATFLAEMLKHAGLGTPSEGFGGGAGEAQFASFLALEQARAMTRAGGIGLSAAIFQSLMETEHDG